jgi:predicted permease
VKSSGAAAGSDRHAAWSQRILVVTEVALSLVLVAGASVMLRSFQTLMATDSGIQPDHVVSMELVLARASYQGGAERDAFLNNVLERLQATSGVQAAAFTNELPLRGGSLMSLLVHARGSAPPADPDARTVGEFLNITPDYFRTMGIPLLRGRAPRPSSDSLAPGEVAIGRSLAQRLWPDRAAVGERLVLPLGDKDGSVVVGVVGDVRTHSLDEAAAYQVYLPNILATHVALVARGQLPHDILALRMRDAVRAVDAEQAVFNVRPMQQVILSAITPRRVQTLLIGIFGALALLLAAIGVYGVIAHTVAQRTREIGIRMALGGRPSIIMGSVFREGFVMVGAGVIIGLIGAWALARTLASLVYGVSPRDPLAFAAAPIVLFIAALLAMIVPAWRATQVDPLDAIRAE